MQGKSEIEIFMLYKLDSGENLQSVAKKFKISTQLLLDANEGIKIKDSVTIAIPKFKGNRYKVEVGDTIEGICDRFSITKEEFLAKNRLNFIYPTMIVEV